MPAKMLQAPPSRPRTSRSSIPSAKTRTNTRTTHLVQASGAKKSTASTLNEQEEQTDETPETPAKKKKAPPMPILAEYVINAKTMLGVQAVHRDSKATVEGLWSCRRYFEESTLKVEKAANDRGVKPVLKSSIASIYSKSMKKEDYFRNEVNEPKDWNDVESLVNHLAKSLSKGIRVDFTIEYHARVVEPSPEEENELDLSDQDAPPCAKRARKVILQKLVFDIRLQPRHF